MTTFVTTILRGLMTALGSIPLKVHYALSPFIAWLARCVFRYRLSVVRDNIRQAFLDKTPAEINGIVKDFYRHFADIVVETLWFGACHNPRRLLRQNLVTVSNPEFVEQLSQGGKSVITLLGHCGNWELLGGFIQYCGHDSTLREENVCVVHKQLDNKVWDSIMALNRTAPLAVKPFPGYVETRQLVRYVYEHISECKFYFIITDQRPYFKSPANIEISFMGRKCKTMTGGAALARKFAMPVCYLRMERQGRGRYVISYVPVCEDASKVDLRTIMERYYELLEEDLRKDPANYLWTHKRWKWAKRG